jgi:hypothetical protein
MLSSDSDISLSLGLGGLLLAALASLIGYLSYKAKETGGISEITIGSYVYVLHNQIKANMPPVHRHTYPYYNDYPVVKINYQDLSGLIAPAKVYGGGRPRWDSVV